MRFIERLAACLLPGLVASLVIPTDPLPSVKETAPEFVLGQLPTFEQLQSGGATIEFKLPCDDCDEEEKLRLEDETFSLTIPSRQEVSCGDDVDTGIRFNGEKLLAERLDLNGHRRWAHPSNLHFNNTLDTTFNADWELTCGCKEDWTKHDYDGCTEYGYILALQLRFGAEQKSWPGFTFTFDQHVSPAFMRFSPFVDDIASSFDGVSLESLRDTKHWQSSTKLHTPLPKVLPQDLPTLTQVLSSTFTTSSILEGTTGTVQFSATLTEEKHNAFTGKPEHKSDKDGELDENHLEAHHDELDDISVDSGNGDDSEDLQSTTSGEKLHNQASQLLNDVKHKFHGFETTAALMAQSVLKQLKEHLPHCTLHEHVSAIHKQGDSPLMYGTPTWLDTQTETPTSSPTSSAASSATTTEYTPSPVQNTDVQPAYSAKAAKISAGIVLLVLLSGIGLLHMCRDPRCRAEMATRREEARNRRLYRRAAQRQKFKNFFSWIRGAQSEKQVYMMPSPTQPLFNEKNVPPMLKGGYGPEASHGRGMREGISEMRKAHQFVERILSGGRGESIVGRAAPRSRGHRRNFSDADSEKSTPPTYEQCKNDIVIVDGLTFMSALPDESPDSSVVDTSSRHSDNDSDYGKD